MTTIRVHPIDPENECAVELYGVCKTYGAQPFRALNNVDLRVPKGTIYGLLGPSGCGKTTLIRCILGRFKLDRGYILVFGHKPGTPECGIPGKKVGYMPQELALFQEFTIKETFLYFGKLLSMKTSCVEERIEFLTKFLKLPEVSRLVKNLSGGQQRRVSFAAALLHQPELLILDEPTVGLDPVLRTSIWNHLLAVAHNENTTIIITTHYIEEARKAQTVGLMRAGRLLVEAPPEELVTHYEMPTLEDVFLKICIQDQAKQIRPHVSLIGRSQSFIKEKKKKCVCLCSCPVIRAGPMSALCYKNIIRLWRSPVFLLFQFLIPVIQILLLGIAIGKDPHHLPMAIVNEDNYRENGFGAYFVQHLNKEFILDEFYNTMDSALDAARDGKVWGVMHIGENFTNALTSRFMQGLDADDMTLNGSIVNIQMDKTNQQVSLLLEKELMTSFQLFLEHVARNLSSVPNSNFTRFIIKFEDPIFGSTDPSYTEFMAPGISLSIVYFMAMALTALAFVMERKEGLLDRSWVSGVRAIEVMLSHVVVECLVMVIQAGLVFVFTIYVINVPCKGPVETALFLIILQGFCGMASGLVISAICEQEFTALILTLGLFYPFWILGGILWPIQGFPEGLRYISYGLPFTYAGEALRAILSRGAGIMYFTVWIGYVITICWTLVFIILSAVLFRIEG